MEGPACLIEMAEPRKKPDPIIPPIPNPARLYAFSFFDCVDLFLLLFVTLCKIFTLDSKVPMRRMEKRIGYIYKPAFLLEKNPPVF